MSDPAEKTGNAGASRIAPRSARAAVEPERIPQPSQRRSRRARHPVVVVGNAILTILILVAVLGAMALAVGKQRFEAPGPLDRERVVNIPRGLGIKDIADLLQREGIIDQPWVFMGGVIALKARDELKYGEYMFRRQASLRDVVDTLVEGKAIQHQVTVPEGLTSEQIVARLLENDILTGSLKEIPKEGTLLPETYRFTRGTTREQIIQRMQQAQRRAIQDAWERRAPDLPLQNADQFVVLASIVEKETGRADERARVAGVFVNRLKQKMKLQSDPTIIYGLVGGKGTLGRPIQRSEIDQPTPYNTYVITGLPPGPIANPGRAALEAVANPSRTREIYFVADGTGGHSFSETLDQHQRNVTRLRQIEQQQKDRTPPDATLSSSPGGSTSAPAAPASGTTSSLPSTSAQSPRPAQAAPPPTQGGGAPAPRGRSRPQDAAR
jgi:peptidoglycan lytic transglycosylase G